jgi:hypothetical protein
VINSLSAPRARHFLPAHVYNWIAVSKSICICTQATGGQRRGGGTFKGDAIMCDYRCKVCPVPCQIGFAFGPLDVTTTNVKKEKCKAGWYERELKKHQPARRNEQGVKLCSREGCDEPREAGTHMCPAHRLEYQRGWEKDNLERRRAYKAAQYKGAK